MVNLNRFFGNFRFSSLLLNQTTVYLSFAIHYHNARGVKFLQTKYFLSQKQFSFYYAVLKFNLILVVIISNDF